jgi:hypothetical protein
MSGKSLGTAFVEISLDAERYTRGQQKLYKDATTTTLNIEENFKKLGIRSSAEMDLMRGKITNSYNMIANSSKATANDIMRAERAKNTKLKQLAEQQYSHQVSLLKSFEKHWVSVGGAIHHKVGGIFRSVFSLKGALVSLAGAAGIGLTTKAFLDAANVTEQYQIRLKFLLRDADAAKQVFRDMSDYAARVPHTYEQIMESATRLSGIMSGGSEEIKQWMPLIGDLAAATGFTIQETTGQIIRMYSAGAAAADMFRERGISTMLGFTAGVHYSAEETRRILLDSWSKTGSQFRGAADELGKTWTGLMSMLHDRWFQFRNLVMEQGLFDNAKNALDGMLEKIDSLEKNGRLDEWAKTMAGVVTDSFKIMTEAVALFINTTTWALEGWIKTYGVIMRTQIQSSIAGYDLAITQVDIKMRNVQKEMLLGETEFGQLDRLEKIMKKLNDQKKKLVLEKEPYVLQLAAIANLGAYAEDMRGLGKDTVDAFAALNREIEKLGVNIKKSGLTMAPGGTTGFAGYKTYMTYYQGVLNEQSGIISNINIDMDGLAKKYLEQLELAEKQRKEWEKISTTIGTSFTDALVGSLDQVLHSFEDFAKDVKNLFLKLWMDKAITQPIIEPTVNYLGGMFGIPGAPDVIGPPTENQMFMQNMAMYAGAGAVGYGMGGIGGGIGSMGGMFGGQLLGSAASAAVGGSLGAALGSAIPIVGTVLGGVAGAYIGEMSESDPPKPKIDLLYDVIDGKVKLIGEEWQNSPRSQELIDQVQQTLQTQIDFFKMLGLATGQVFQTGQIALSGKNAGGIFQGTIASGVTDLAQAYATGGGRGIYAGFEEAFEQAWNIGFGKLTWENLAKKIGYNKEKYGYTVPVGQRTGMSGPEMLTQLQSGNYQNFSSWLQTGMGDKYYNPYWRPSGNAPTMNALDKVLEEYNKKLQPIADTMATGIGNAFLTALDSGAFDTFGQTLRQSTYESVKQGITQGLGAELLTGENSPLTTGLTKLLGAANQYAAGEITFSQAQQMIDSSIAGLDDAISKMEPIMQPVYEWLRSLSTALDINTVAVSSNTDAIMGPVNSFLMRLDTGPLAPSQSLAGLANIEDKLYTAALADPSKFSAYASFMTSSSLPTAKGLTGDYAGYVAGVKSDVTGIPWVQSGMGSAPSAQSIGYEVGQALGPMLYDLQESGKITVNVVVDGQVVKSAVLDALSDRDVVATIQDM